MADEVTMATDSARAVEGIVPAQHRWLFTRKGEKGQPLLALHPRTNHDDNRGVTFLVEATRPADLIVVDQPRLGPDYPVYGYAPYAYVWPLYVDGYAPVFIVHHPWEDRHAYGHPGNFFHGFAGPPLGAHAGGRFR